jgi:hypothetical protein
VTVALSSRAHVWPKPATIDAAGMLPTGASLASPEAVPDTPTIEVTHTSPPTTQPHTPLPDSFLTAASLIPVFVVAVSVISVFVISVVRVDGLVSVGW